MRYKTISKEKLLEILKDETVGIRTKYRICKFFGISKAKSEKAGQMVYRTKPAKRKKAKPDQYKFSAGQWI